MLESRLAPLVKFHGDYILAELVHLAPEDCHDDEHDQVEESELQDNEEAVGEDQEQDKCKRVEEQCLALAAFLDRGMIKWVQVGVHAFEVAPMCRVINVHVLQLVHIFLTHLEMPCLSIPHKNFLDSGGAGADFTVVYVHFTVSEVHI